MICEETSEVKGEFNDKGKSMRYASEHINPTMLDLILHLYSSSKYSQNILCVKAQIWLVYQISGPSKGQH